MPSLATASQQGGSTGSLLLLLLPLLLLGFLFWSQRRRARQFEQVQSELEVGNQVSTTSGLLGTLTAIDDEVAEVEAAPGVRLRFDRRAVLPASKIGRGPATPPAGDDAADGPDAPRQDG